MSIEKNFKGKEVIKWALTIGIAIVLNLFFSVAIQTVYPEPEFQDFCENRPVQNIADEQSCVAIGGQWNPTLAPKPALDDAPGYCDVHFTCGMQYEDARNEYARNVFVALVVLGALSLGVGYALRISPAVSAGLSYGGVLTFIIASMRYWDAAGDIIRLGIVGIALIALIVVGVKKFKE